MFCEVNPLTINKAHSSTIELASLACIKTLIPTGNGTTTYPILSAKTKRVLSSKSSLIKFSPQNYALTFGTLFLGPLLVSSIRIIWTSSITSMFRIYRYRHNGIRRSGIEVLKKSCTLIIHLFIQILTYINGVIRLWAPFNAWLSTNVEICYINKARLHGNNNLACLKR